MAGEGKRGPCAGGRGQVGRSRGMRAPPLPPPLPRNVSHVHMSTWAQYRNIKPEPILSNTAETDTAETNTENNTEKMYL
jgi:hypothetical protein